MNGSEFHFATVWDVVHRINISVSLAALPLCDLEEVFNLSVPVFPIYKMRVIIALPHRVVVKI